MQTVLSALKAANIPYTKVVSFAFYGWVIPSLGEIAFPGSPVPSEVKVYGDGNVRGGMLDSPCLERANTHTHSHADVHATRTHMHMRTHIYARMHTSYSFMHWSHASLATCSVL